MKFKDLGLAEPLLRAVIAEGYTIPTPIQVQSIPHVLAGRDLLGCAQTGTGKTAAFALPILHRLHHSNGAHPRVRPIRVLVLSPTRELASQIGDSFRAYGRNTGLRGVVIYGGVNQNRQISALHGGTDILVATPGRLLDLMNQGYIDLGSVEIFVLDEADRMLDMGFIHDIRKIVAKVPKSRQTLFFSATMPADIRKLADNILHKPVSVQVAPESAAADNVEQSVYHVRKRNKPALLAHVLRCTKVTRSLVFTRTKSGANRVVRDLGLAGIASEAIHGNKSQSARARAIDNFKKSKTHVLVATDIAARGLDIDGISHVVNFDLPNVPETYVHRIGRTARAGASGIAVSFCDPDERSSLKAIEQLIRKNIAVIREQPEYPAGTEAYDNFDRSPQSPIHNPRRPKQTHNQPRGHAAPRKHDAPARQGRPAHGKPGARHGGSHAGHGKPGTGRGTSSSGHGNHGAGHGRSDRSAAAASHGRREQPAHAHSANNRGAAANRDTAQQPASHGRSGGHSHAAPAQPGVGRKHRSRRRNRRGRGAGPRR